MQQPPHLIRLLYVDDDPGVCQLVRRNLERNGFSVELANDADQGLALARMRVFDAIALDHYMPKRDGLDVLTDLISLPDAPPVIFVTAAEEPRIAIAAMKQGAFDYVIKDVAGMFIEFLKTSVRQAQAQQCLRREREAALRALQESRDRLEKLAEQQALLLREVNHRIANSLQLIASLIELQARKVADADGRAALRRAAERVEAVTLVHRRLYTSSDVKHVAMDLYLNGLVDELRRAVAGEERQGRIILHADPILLETDQAVSIGLVVNELVTNALKYAYPDRAGDIRIRFAETDGVVALTVEDDGIGYQAGAAPKGSGLGSTIVSAMARTVKATVQTQSDADGTRVILRIGQAG